MIFCSAHFARLVKMSLLFCGEQLTVCKFGFCDLCSFSLPQVNEPLSAAGIHVYLPAKDYTTH